MLLSLRVPYFRNDRSKSVIGSEVSLKVPGTVHIIAPGFNPGNKAQPHLNKSCKDDTKEADQLPVATPKTFGILTTTPRDSCLARGNEHISID